MIVYTLKLCRKLWCQLCLNNARIKNQQKTKNNIYIFAYKQCASTSRIMSAVLFITVPELVIEWGTIQKRGLQMIWSEKAALYNKLKCRWKLPHLLVIWENFFFYFNIIEIFTLQKIHPSNVYNSIVFSIFTELYKYHHDPILEHFHHSKKNPWNF